MIVIFEGIDGAGKTTLCEALRSVLNTVLIDVEVFYHKESTPGKSIAERLKRISLFEERLYDEALHVYDRATVIDDYVYEPIFNQTASIFALSSFLTLWITEMVQQSLVLHIETSFDVIKARLQTRGDEFISLDQLHDIYSMYLNAYDLLDIQPVYIDSLSKDTLQQCIEQIKQYVEEKRK